MSCERTPGPETAGDCGPCSPARRNRFFPDKRMLSSDYRLEQTHLIERRRLINRAMLGSGIIQGYPLRILDSGSVVVGTGVALDCCGREVVACKEVELNSPTDFLWLVEGECGMEVADPPEEPVQQEQKQSQKGKDECPPEESEPCDHYLLCAHYAEQPVDGIRVDDGCGSVKCEANHLCETVVYSLVAVEHCPAGICGCLPNLWDRLEGQRDRADWESVAGGPMHSLVADIHDRGTHEQLVHWSLERLNNLDFCKPCKLDRVGEFYVGLDTCVPLACVRIGFRCGEAYIAEIVDAWRPRRLARPNNILFDLIRGCDLVRIQDVGWREWLEPDSRRVSLSDFAAKFEKPQRTEDSQRRRGSRRRRGARAVAATHFWVCFSGPVQVSSLTPDVITITLIRRDIDEDVRNVVRVPIPAIEVAPTTPGDPEHTTRAFRPLASGRFWEGEISDYDATGFETENLVEIEVRTGFILDTLGQEVAGGGRYVPTSGCAPGGRFLSSFTVVPDDDVNDDMEQQSAAKAAEEA